MNIVLKISGEALKDENNISTLMLTRVLNDVKYIQSKGYNVILVCGGGNFWRGRNKLDIDNSISDEIGMLATDMNALAISSFFNKNNIKTKVYSTFEIENFIPKYTKEKALEDLNENYVVVLGGGLGRPFISTDLATVTRAYELNSDMIIMAKNIDAVYDKDPKLEGARRYSVISHKELLDNQNKMGKDTLGVMDYEALLFIEKTKPTIYLYNAKNENGVIDILNGRNPGTIIKS